MQQDGMWPANGWQNILILFDARLCSNVYLWMNSGKSIWRARPVGCCCIPMPAARDDRTPRCFSFCRHRNAVAARCSRRLITHIKWLGLFVFVRSHLIAFRGDYGPAITARHMSPVNNYTKQCLMHAGIIRLDSYCRRCVTDAFIRCFIVHRPLKLSDTIRTAAAAAAEAGARSISVYIVIECRWDG
jgi:hypothetical protein